MTRPELVGSDLVDRDMVDRDMVDRDTVDCDTAGSGGPSVLAAALADDLSFQTSLFGCDVPSVDETFRSLERVDLDDDCWIEVVPGWLQGADTLVAELVAGLPWGRRHVVMYDQLRAEPRLTSWWDTAAGRPEPLPILGDLRRVLSRRYSRPFDTIGFNLYRDGRDSVAWHGDRERFRMAEATVAIVSLGSPRSFLVRARGGGPSRGWRLGHGDLLVMGGACQHHWEHSVPKTVRPVGPRLSIMFRHHLTGPDDVERPTDDL